MENFHHTILSHPPYNFDKINVDEYFVHFYDLVMTDLNRTNCWLRFVTLYGDLHLTIVECLSAIFTSSTWSNCMVTLNQLTWKWDHSLHLGPRRHDKSSGQPNLVVCVTMICFYVNSKTHRLLSWHLEICMVKIFHTILEKVCLKWHFLATLF